MGDGGAGIKPALHDSEVVCVGGGLTAKEAPRKFGAGGRSTGLKSVGGSLVVDVVVVEILRRGLLRMTYGFYFWCGWAMAALA